MTRAATVLAVLLLFGLTLLLLLARCGSSEPVQYPTGQRPCTEARAALDAVTAAQLEAAELEAGPGPNDPQGKVRTALRGAQEVLGYRAGESSAYSAARYNAAADALANQISPLIEQYDRENPDTPFVEATGFTARMDAYDHAKQLLVAECQS